ncbi:MULTISPECIES: hypothetical protein [Streptomyces]|uniref:Integral membrane protein n=2 Tax=Streptomyces TaxID=1883 RepID=A0A100Y2U6_9ACTN|nr:MULTISPECIES: hypothetical protein [Streptomyces]KUH36674.1 hypothetical protein ATE80_22375 [Streptomyces kanasensis]UUS31897.1 hypothetical protein NRO40_14430 [Streptomyces changanensis]
MRKWLAAGAGVNLVLGVPGVVPVWLVWYWASNWPLAGLGWTQAEPTENDGMLPWFMVATPVLVLFGLGWWLVNRPLRRRAGVRGRVYWSVAVAAASVPTAALIVMDLLGD